jgi:hypothetical protein
MDTFAEDEPLVDTSVEGIYRKLSVILARAKDVISYASFSRRKHEVCPFCHLNLEEYVNSMPPGKFVSVDVPSDFLIAEKVIGVRKLRSLIIEANKNLNHIHFKKPTK